MNYLNRSTMGLPSCLSGGSSGSNGSTTPQATPEQMMQMYTQGLPAVLGAMNGALPQSVTGMANAAATANPIYTQSGLSQLNTLAPGYQQAGANIAQQQAGTTNQLLQGAGGDAARSAVNLNNTLNPTQAAANTGAQSMLGAINLNGLSPGEQNATERSLNQSNVATNNLGLDNATNAVSNAMNFGGAFNSKIGIMGNALNSATNVANAQNQQVNPVNTAMGASSAANNFGLGMFNPNQSASTLNTPFSFGSSFGNQLAGVSAASRGTTSSGSAQGGLCFLTTACCEYKGLPDDCEELTMLRNFRDKYVPVDMVQEYYKIAPAIVQSIHKNEAALEYVYGVVKDCVSEIKRGNTKAAIDKYVHMVNNLK